MKSKNKNITFIKKSIKIFLISTLLNNFSCSKYTDTSVKLYYSDVNGMYIVPINKKLSLKNMDLGNISTKKEIKIILNELKKDLKKEKLVTCIPEKTKFYDIYLDREKELISLSMNVKSGKVNEIEEILMVSCLKNTINNLKNYKNLKINKINYKGLIDYSEAFTKDKWLNSFGSENTELLSKALVYWKLKNNSFYIPITVNTKKNNIFNLIKILKEGPKDPNLKNSIPEEVNVAIKSSNSTHIEVELSSKKEITKKEYEETKKAILLTIYELAIFKTIKFITPYNINKEEIIDLTKIDPRKTINMIDIKNQKN